MLKNDEVIQAGDSEAIKIICQTEGEETEDGNETDSPTQNPSHFDIAAMRTHLFEIFSHLLSPEKISISK